MAAFVLDTSAVLTILNREEGRHQAAIIKSQTPLSVADAWIASLARVQHAELVHKDPEFEQVTDLQMLKLPYKM